MSGTEVQIDAAKARVTDTIMLVMGGQEGEQVSSYALAQAISEVFLGLLIMAKFIEMPAESFEGIRAIAEAKDEHGGNIVDRAATSLRNQMNIHEVKIDQL